MEHRLIKYRYKGVDVVSDVRLVDPINNIFRINPEHSIAFDMFYDAGIDRWVEYSEGADTTIEPELVELIGEEISRHYSDFIVRG